MNTPNFPENCMKSKEFGRPGGGVRPSRPPPRSASDYDFFKYFPQNFLKSRTHPNSTNVAPRFATYLNRFYLPGGTYLLQPGLVFRESWQFSPGYVTSSAVNGGFPFVSQTFQVASKNNVDLRLELFICFYFKHVGI